MKRELTTALLGAALLVPVSVEAQRERPRADDDGRRVEKLAPITVGGRLANRARPPAARSGYVGSRVVYTSRPRYRTTGYHRVGRVHRPYRDLRIRVRFDWGHRPIVVDRSIRIDRRVGPGELRRLLGKRTVKRIRAAGRRDGLRGAPRGHWVETRRHGRVLVVTMDRTDVAEFVDYDRDGWIDDAFLFRHDRGGPWVVRP